MTLHRFFVSPDAVSGDRFPLPHEVRHQVRTVLRLGDGDRIVLLPGDGTEARCLLVGDECIVEDRRRAEGEPAHRLTVVQALLKGDALEEVVQRGTEVGVSEFRLAVTDRCVARELSTRKLDRLRAIAREAAEQSERGLVPPVHSPIPFDRALSGDAVLLYERAAGERRLGALPSPPSALIIGPEGGFTERELARVREAGIAMTGLGPRILRSQTVAPVAAAIVLWRTGDFA